MRAPVNENRTQKNTKDTEVSFVVFACHHVNGGLQADYFSFTSL
ncbi:hypothetical protein EDF71_12547 [Comamonas sp. JUb58]|nr:hypothetical protein EDF71_12547 [Comamonas sp. JUb58]